MMAQFRNQLVTLREDEGKGVEVSPGFVQVIYLVIYTALIYLVIYAALIICNNIIWLSWLIPYGNIFHIHQDQRKAAIQEIP